MSAADSGIERPGKVQVPEEEWKAKLSAESFTVTRESGTEQPWTGALLENKETGVYTCICCGAELFDSATKFDSGTGWPSFNDVLSDKDVPNLPAIDTQPDTSKGRIRTEVLCGKCDAHLGHVFTDGPQPTGLRYCINSVCLKFEPKKN